MSIIVGELIGGAIGLFVGWVLVFYIPDRRHRRQCLRKFDAHVARLEAAHVARLEAAKSRLEGL